MKDVQEARRTIGGEVENRRDRDYFGLILTRYSGGSSLVDTYQRNMGQFCDMTARNKIGYQVS